MPNWVHHKLFISGPPSDVKAFADRAKGKEGRAADDKKRGRSKDERRKKSAAKISEQRPEVLDFEAFIPILDEEQNKKRGGRGSETFASLLYTSRRVENWGTSRNACFSKVIRSSKGRIYYQFCTAWDHALHFFMRVSRQYPRLRFSVYFHLPTVEPSRYWHHVIKNGKELMQYP